MHLEESATLVKRKKNSMSRTDDAIVGRLDLGPRHLGDPVGVQALEEEEEDLYLEVESPIFLEGRRIPRMDCCIEGSRKGYPSCKWEEESYAEAPRV